MRTVFFGGGSPEEERRPPSNFVIPTPLSPEELRVLGCLIEKQFLTPDIYPLSLNALVTACNQKTSREPVTAYDDEIVLRALDSLQKKGLSTRITGDGRVVKYREWLSDKTQMKVSEMAILCVMILRGPQTLNELKDRTSRMHEFGTTEEVDDVLNRLAERQPQPLITRLPRLAGQKEPRSMHLLAGPVNVEELQNAAPPTAPLPRSAHEERIAQLEAEVSSLRERLAALEQQFSEFRTQFE